MVTLGIAGSVCSFFSSDKGGSGLRGVVWRVDIFPLWYVLAVQEGPKSCGC